MSALPLVFVPQVLAAFQIERHPMIVPANLLQMYATLTAQRPELKVLLLHFTAGGWWHGDHAGMPMDIVTALIRVAWEDGLPDGYHSRNTPYGWCVQFVGLVTSSMEWHVSVAAGYFSDPITALYDFHMMSSK